ncbi:DUF1540 domain-containing protein [Allostreptomyces psammosilenae]|uniref:DUF1540 domain-containing protein n=1 Tax=Allostreptomyces psammosilenae TaxID=1892865 RepID=A0A852ZTI0_9ACTN|nr:DUF1540 domain-containing protein [Allostreptomyces psammosilenae]NYI04847.1 hypothetical protein [Allostreptomyces psammosilenae]
MQMPVINECAVDACAYNQEHACHALAITVGGRDHAQCDTYFPDLPTGGDPSGPGHVGACTMADCRHNTDLECQAPGIDVGYHASAVDCLTYQPA